MPREYYDLADLCQERGVRWVVGGRLSDLRDPDDAFPLDLDALLARRHSRLLSRDVRRGQAASAAEGKPPGLVPYGYKRRYHPTTGGLLGQDPDPTTAPVVREVFARLAAGEPVNVLRKDLTGRGIVSPGTYSRHKHPPESRAWTSRSLYVIARNRAYIGQRVYGGKVLEGVAVMWPPLVAPEVFWAVQQRLGDPARRGERPAQVKYLLTGLVRCDVCGAPLAAKRNPSGKAGYACWENRCVGILAEVLDRFVVGLLLDWLADPEVLADLTRVDDTEAAAQAQAEVSQARVELRTLAGLAKAGRVSPGMAADLEEGLLARIEDAGRRSRASAVPPVVAGVLGPDAAEQWAALDLIPQREVIRQVLEVRLRPAGRGTRIHPLERVSWRWLLGPERAEPAVTAGPLDPASFYGKAGPRPGATAHPEVCEVCGKAFVSARSTRVCSTGCKRRRTVARRAARQAATSG